MPPPQFSAAHLLRVQTADGEWRNPATTELGRTEVKRIPGRGADAATMSANNRAGDAQIGFQKILIGEVSRRRLAFFGPTLCIICMHTFFVCFFSAAAVLPRSAAGEVGSVATSFTQ